MGAHGAVRIRHRLLDEVVDGDVHGLAVKGVVPVDVLADGDLGGGRQGGPQEAGRGQEDGQGAGTHDSSIGSTLFTASSVDGPPGGR
jgi:hypothetical protein